MQSITLPDWILSLCSTNTSSIYASSSNGQIHLLSTNPLKWSSISSFNAHNGPIHKLKSNPNNSNILISCSEDSTVKLWDSRIEFKPIHILNNSRNLPFYSLDVNHGLIASGSQLKGTDSELILWDERKLDKPLRSFIDSHNDDITDVKFHPLRKNILLSGATDNYVNIYDINIEIEDDAQLQCINFASVHSANFLSSNRIYVLSHMETFGIFDLSTENDLDPEINNNNIQNNKRGDKDFGDIREKWNCEYVIDLYAPGYVACGSNSENIVRLFEFDAQNENFNPSKCWNLQGGHGDDIVRDISIINNTVFTAGEDSKICAWTMEGLQNTQDNFTFYDINDNDTNNDEETKPEKDKKKKDKEERKRLKKSLKKSKSSTKSSKRFKPY